MNEDLKQYKIKSNLIIAIVIFLIIVICIILFFVIKDDIKETNLNDNEEQLINNTVIENKTIEENITIVDEEDEDDPISEDYDYGEYGVLIKEKIDNFKNVNFDYKNKYEPADFLKFELVDGKLKYTYFDDVDKIIPDIDDAVSIGLDCDCGSQCNYYYMNDKNELYEVYATTYFSDSNSDIKVLLANDALGFDILDTFESTTCGGGILVYKNLNEEIKVIEYDRTELNPKIEYIDKDKKQIKWLNDNYEYTIYGVNNPDIMQKMLKDEKGNNLVCKEIFHENDTVATYIISDNNYLYYFGPSEFKSLTGKLVKNKKVSKYSEKDGIVTVKFADNSKKNIYVE